MGELAAGLLVTWPHKMTGCPRIEEEKDVNAVQGRLRDRLLVQTLPPLGRKAPEYLKGGKGHKEARPPNQQEATITTGFPAGRAELGEGAAAPQTSGLLEVFLQECTHHIC